LAAGAQRSCVDHSQIELQTRDALQGRHPGLHGFHLVALPAQIRDKGWSSLSIAFDPKKFHHHSWESYHNRSCGNLPLRCEQNGNLLRFMAPGTYRIRAGCWTAYCLEIGSGNVSREMLRHTTAYFFDQSLRNTKQLRELNLFGDRPNSAVRAFPGSRAVGPHRPRDCDLRTELELKLLTSLDGDTKVLSIAHDKALRSEADIILESGNAVAPPYGFYSAVVSYISLISAHLIHCGDT
jgi:hypothetical protein